MGNGLCAESVTEKLWNGIGASRILYVVENTRSIPVLLSAVNVLANFAENCAANDIIESGGIQFVLKRLHRHTKCSELKAACYRMLAATISSNPAAVTSIVNNDSISVEVIAALKAEPDDALLQAGGCAFLSQLHGFGERARN